MTGKVINMILVLSLVAFLASTVQAADFDIMKYGAVADEKTDISKALIAAFKEACAAPTPSNVLIPKGIYLLNEVKLEGPCTAPMSITLDGNLITTEDAKNFPSGVWITINYINHLTILGTGVLDGKGAASWKASGCNKAANCARLPMNEEPVIGVTATNCTLTGTTNGVRIKSWPAMEAGEVSDVHFEDITMTNVGNPIIIDQYYCPWNQCDKKKPSLVKIGKVSFKNIRGTSTTANVLSLVCSPNNPCQGVEVADIDLAYSGPEGPAVSTCANVKPVLSGKLVPAVCSAPAPL
ncbi:hypothetical protein ACFE04_030351 [Oxalis oulophora]